MDGEGGCQCSWPSLLRKDMDVVLAAVTQDCCQSVCVCVCACARVRAQLCLKVPAVNTKTIWKRQRMTPPQCQYYAHHIYYALNPSSSSRRRRRRSVPAKPRESVCVCVRKGIAMVNHSAIVSQFTTSLVYVSSDTRNLRQTFWNKSFAKKNTNFTRNSLKKSLSLRRLRAHKVLSKVRKTFFRELLSWKMFTSESSFF